MIISDRTQMMVFALNRVMLLSYAGLQLPLLSYVCTHMVQTWNATLLKCNQDA